MVILWVLACAIAIIPSQSFTMYMKAQQAPIPTVFDKLLTGFGIGNPVTTTPVLDEKAQKAIALNECDREIAECNDILLLASKKEYDDTNKVYESLSRLEKLMRKRNNLDGGVTSSKTIASLSGSWRLIFTSGTVDTQKKMGGRINYFPIKAIQSFDTTEMRICNGIYVGDFAVLKFFGNFEWLFKARRIEFDFDEIQILFLRFNLPSGGAAKIGSSTGLGSEGNVELEKKGKKPFFNWISASEEIATARGGGGGLALWRRIDMEEGF